MFFTLSKILDLLVAPLTWALVLVLLGVVLLGRRRASAICGLLAFAILVVFSSERVANAIQSALEAGARTTMREDVTYDALVLLGGLGDEGASGATGRLELNEGGDRLVGTYDLLRAGKARHVIVSSGLLRPEPGRRPEAQLVAEKLAAWGIPAERILVEDRARNTRENATEVARIVKARGFRTVLLVTSAAHLPRALGCFRAEGLTPDAFPVDRRAGRGGRWLPRAEALDLSTDALREATGRLVYWVMGYTR
ncbi:MAG TPA: YdcF family protein [Anaeromyxobacteraceae bacterium]|nr:YdcF family protein [Anaeromyxobacteraceae bacterium]